MPIARHYSMQAAEGRAAALASALATLAGDIRRLPGALNVEVLQDRADTARFIFIETWENMEAHAASSDRVPAASMASLKTALREPPTGTTLDYLTEESR